MAAYAVAPPPAGAPGLARPAFGERGRAGLLSETRLEEQEAVQVEQHVLTLKNVNRVVTELERIVRGHHDVTTIQGVHLERCAIDEQMEKIANVFHTSFLSLQNLEVVGAIGKKDQKALDNMQKELYIRRRYHGDVQELCTDLIRDLEHMNVGEDRVLARNLAAFLQKVREIRERFPFTAKENFEKLEAEVQEFLSFHKVEQVGRVLERIHNLKILYEDGCGSYCFGGCALAAMVAGAGAACVIL